MGCVSKGQIPHCSFPQPLRPGKDHHHQSHKKELTGYRGSQKLGAAYEVTPPEEGFETELEEPKGATPLQGIQEGSAHAKNGLNTTCTMPKQEENVVPPRGGRPIT